MALRHALGRPLSELHAPGDMLGAGNVRATPKCFATRPPVGMLRRPAVLGGIKHMKGLAMQSTTQDKTPQQLMDEGHWNGEVVEGAHERLFDLVEHYRKLRSIPMAEAIKVVHDDLQNGLLTPAQRACVDIYRRWRADMLGTAGVTHEVTFREFEVWMCTGQFPGLDAVSAPPSSGCVIKLSTPKRQMSFTDLMARMDDLVQVQGLPVVRAAGALVNEAILSDPANPCELRLALRAAMGRGGRPGYASGPAAGLPSIDTMRKWYLKHRTGAVEQTQAPSGDNAKVKKWVSRQSRWMEEARSIKAVHPDLSALGVYAELIRRWRDWWGNPVDRRKFLDEFERQSWTR